MTTEPQEGSAGGETGSRVSTIGVLVRMLSVVIVPLLGMYLLKVVLSSMGILGH